MKRVVLCVLVIIISSPPAWKRLIENVKELKRNEFCGQQGQQQSHVSASERRRNTDKFVKSIIKHEFQGRNVRDPIIENLIRQDTNQTPVEGTRMRL